MENNDKKHSNYLRFFAMIGTSMLVMFFLMYLNSYQIIDHFWFSETRLFMTMIMGGAMIIIMLLYMLQMYKDKNKNIITLAFGVLLIGAAVWLVRSQVTVSDVDYMEGMIPHHSIAILTSDRSQIKDVRVRELADGIIKAQRKEIMEMQWLIHDIRKNGIAATEQEKQMRPVPKFEGSTEKETTQTAGLPPGAKKSNQTGDLAYNPPKPEEAPENIRQAVMRGHAILTNTKKELPDYVGNELNCHNCHFEAGLTKGGKNGGISYVGVAAKYPKYRNRQHNSVDLAVRVDNCFMRSLNGKPLPPESEDMIAIITYFHWISKDIPIYADIPWLGLKPLENNHKPDKASGQEIYAQICAECHGHNGQGGMQHQTKTTQANNHQSKNGHDENGPPLWGDNSFTDGAGMSKLENLASFAYYNMPRHNPVLTREQALDVAAYVTAQPRPKFEKDDKPW
jgi:cytochrome c